MPIQELTPESSDRLLKAIYEKTGIQKNSKVRRLWPVWVAAASLTGLLILGSLWYATEKNKSTTPALAKLSHQNDIAPGGNKAILTLSDGSQVILDSANNGTISKEGNVTVIKLDDGQLAYHPTSGNAQPQTVQYNTITTPKGGQYQLVLSDGTKVWLNAASSLKYPTTFIGNERKVELTGEGYFEVKHDPSKPFFVSSEGMTVKVLGTHFNINAYPDEDIIKATLLKGSVEVNATNQSTMLIPGEQAQMDWDAGQSSRIRTVKNVDLDQVVAWKNGYFSFSDANIQTVMRQLSKWYDIDVSYQGKIPTETFSGKVYRNTSLKNVLEILSLTNLKIGLQGKTIIISTL